jgi:HEAT repeat protein
MTTDMNAGEPMTGSNWAFIVCIDKYQDDALEQGENATQYGEEMAAVLSQYYGYEEDHIFQLYDEMATENSINENFYRLIKNLRRNDALFVLLMTHLSASEEGGYYIVPHDGAVDEPWTLISFDHILNYIRKMRPEKSFIMLGECLEGPMIREDRYDNLKYEFPVFQFLSHRCIDPAGGREEVAMFNKAILDVLSGKENISDRYGEISVSRMVEHVQEKLRLRHIRVNLYSSSGRTDFIFVPTVDDRSSILYSQLSADYSIRERMNAISELVTSTRMSDPGASGAQTEKMASEMTNIARNPDENINVRNRAIWSLGELNYRGAMSDLYDIFANSPDRALQESAFDALIKIEDDAVNGYIRRALDHDDSGIRITAVRALSDMRDEASLPDLLRMLRSDQNTDVRVVVLESLVRFAPLGENEVVYIRDLLGDPSDQIRKHAVNTLSRLNDEESVFEIIRMLEDDENPSVRKECAYALGKMQERANQDRVIEALANAMKRDEDHGVREASVFAMGQFGGEEADKILRKTIRDQDEDDDVIKTAVEQLGNMKSAKAVDSLIRLLEHRNPLVRHAAVRALGTIGDDKATRPLLYMLKDQEKYVRLEADKALKNIETSKKDIGEQEELIPGLSDPSPYVRAESAEKLAESGDPSVVPYLINLLADDELRVRERVTDLLTRYKDAGSVEHIATALDAENFLIRQGAARVFGISEDASYVNFLLKHTNDPSSVVRAEVVMALGNKADDRCLEAIIQAFHDDDEMVRVSAAAALSGHIMRALKENRNDAALEMTAEGKSRLERALAPDHPWSIWYSIMALRNRESELNVSFDIRETDPPSRFTYVVENRSESDIYFALMCLAMDDRITLLDPQYAGEAVRLAPGEVREGILDREKAQCDICKLIAYVRPFEVGMFAENENQYRKVYRTPDAFNRMLLGEKTDIAAADWLTLQRVLP